MISDWSNSVEHSIQVPIESPGDHMPSRRVTLERLARTLSFQCHFLVGWLGSTIAHLSCDEEQPLSTPWVSSSGQDTTGT